MAITPRSFSLNPRLVLVALLTALGVWGTMQVANTSHTLSDYASRACAPSSEASEQWTPQAWGQFVLCLSEHGDPSEAYLQATLAVAHYPSNAELLNLRGFVAARNGDHATAVYDFRTGQRITGSPDGIFENNIAWTTLFQIDSLSADRAERVLLQTRALYTRSLQKGQSCERLHTALYVEYALADLIAREVGTDDARVREAVERYSSIYTDYVQCFARVTQGDELVVEELLSAAAMDAEMGRLAGVVHPTRHMMYAATAAVRAEQLGLDITREWCATTVPVAAAIDTCASLR